MCRIVRVHHGRSSLAWPMASDANRVPISNVGSKRMRATRAFLLFTLLATTVGCQAANKETIPDVLVGVWKTPEPKYPDRFFEIKKPVIIFGTGEGKTDIHPIMNVQKVHKEKNALYIISFMNRDGQYYRFSFFTIPHMMA